MMVIKRFFKLFFCCTLIISHPVFASEKVNPQSPEAIKQMADELEAERKAREAAAKGGQTNNPMRNSGADADSAKITSTNLDRLKQQCEAAREQQIAPLRKQAIEECIAKNVKSVSECEKFYEDYGNAGTTKGGGFRQRMFHNIPECQAYYAAEENFRKNK
jgi:hypothetical protein